MGKIKKYQMGGDTTTRKYPSGMITPSKKEMKSMPKYNPRKIERKDRQATKEEIRNLEKNKPAMPASQKNIGRKGIKVKKAQDGEKLKVSLRAGQLKRLGKLSAKNPEKAEKVGKSMVERATRKQRGVEYLKKNAPALTPSSTKSSVDMKKGGKLKKARSGATLSPSNKNTSSNLAGYKRVIGKSMRMGGSMKKCRGGCY